MFLSGPKIVGAPRDVSISFSPGNEVDIYQHYTYAAFNWDFSFSSVMTFSSELSWHINLLRGVLTDEFS